MIGAMGGTFVRRGIGWFMVGGLAATANASFGCSGGGSQTMPPGYQVSLEIHGSESAFAGRTVVVNGQSLGPIVGTVMAFGLCTTDRNKFFNAPLEVRVLQAGTVLSVTSVKRYACALSDNPGPEEFDVLILRDDGTIASDFSNNSGPYTSCEGPNDPFVCRQGETL